MRTFPKAHILIKQLPRSKTFNDSLWYYRKTPKLINMALKSSIMWLQSIFTVLSLSSSFYGHRSPINPLYGPLSKDILYFATAGMAFLNSFSYDFIHFSRSRLNDLFLNQSISLSSRLKGLFLNQSINLYHLFIYFSFTCPLFPHGTFLSHPIYCITPYILIWFYTSLLPHLGSRTVINKDCNRSQVFCKCTFLWLCFNLIIIKIIFWLYYIIRNKWFSLGALLQQFGAEKGCIWVATHLAFVCVSSWRWWEHLLPEQHSSLVQRTPSQ